MKILVLGNSDTAGHFSGGKTWTAVARDALAGRRAEEVEMRETGFSPLGPSAPAYAEKKTREFEPDLVIIPVATFAFSVGFVWKRVERLLGKRMARWYKRIEDGFDGRTRTRGGVRDRANRTARIAMRRIVGTQPLASPEETAAAYGRVISAMARVENTQLLLVAYGQRGRHNFAPGGVERRRRFLAAVAGHADQHRAPFFDGNAAYDGIPLDLPTTTPDGFHHNQYGHELFGAFVVERVMELLEVRP